MSNQEVVEVAKEKFIKHYSFEDLALCIEHGDIEGLKVAFRQWFDVNLKDEYGVTLIHIAASYNRVEMMKVLLSQPNMELNLKDKYGMTPLMRAALTGNVGSIEFLIENGADTSCKDFERINALRLASKSGNLDEIDAILKGKTYISSVKQPMVYEFMFKSEIIDLLKGLMDESSEDHEYYVNTFGHTVLYYGCKNGSMDLVKFIAEKGIIDINIRGGRMYELPLHFVLSNNTRYRNEYLIQLEIADYLIGKGANLTIKDAAGYTAYAYAAMNDDSETFLVKYEPEEEFLLKIMQIIIDNEVSSLIKRYAEKCFTEKYPNGPEILNSACSHGLKRFGSTKIIVPYIKDKDFIVEQLKKYEFKKCYSTFEPLYERFLELETDNARINELTCILFVSALKYENIPASDYFFNQGIIDLNMIELEDSFLVSASRMQNNIVFESLLKRGANVNQLNSKGLNALIYATRWDDLEMVRVLLKYGADPKIKDKDGATPLLIAASNGYTDVFFELFKVDKDLSQRSNDQFTPFLAACSSCPFDMQMIEALIEAGACLTDVDAKNRNCLHIVIEEHQLLAYLFEKLGKTEFMRLIKAADSNGNRPLDPLLTNYCKEEASKLLAAVPALKELIILPVSINIQSSDLENQGMCLICRDDFVLDDSAIVLSCKHLFHENCYEEWGRTKRICPYCQR